MSFVTPVTFVTPAHKTHKTLREDKGHNLKIQFSLSHCKNKHTELGQSSVTAHPLPAVRSQIGVNLTLRLSEQLQIDDNF